MWPFSYFAYLNPWRAPPSTPLEPSRTNVPIQPLYRRVLGLGPTQPTKRKRAVTDETNRNTKRSRTKAGTSHTNAAPTNTESTSASASAPTRPRIPARTSTPTRNDRPIATPKSRKLSKPDPVTQERLARLERARAATATWNTYDARIYAKLQLRGLEPLMPKVWEVDFGMLPAALFTLDENMAAVKALGKDAENVRNVRNGKASKKDVKGARALQELLDAGGWARDLLKFGNRTGSGAEVRVKRAVDKYLAWTLKDAALEKWPPLCVVVQGGKNVDPSLLQEKLASEMLAARNAWKATSLLPVVPSDLPIYGILCSGPAMLLASLKEEGGQQQNGAPMNDVDEMRTFAAFNWSDAGQDAWNALAVALLAAHVREVLLELEALVEG